MIIYGSGNGQAVLGEAGSHQCPGCEQESTFRAIVRYAYFHIWYLFSFVTKREYFLECESCGCAAPIDAKTTRAQFRRDNIPFLRKRGWMLVLGVVALFIVLGMAGESNRAAQRRELLAAPRVNDIYYADLAQIEGTGFLSSDPRFKNGKAYGVLKLQKIDGEGMVFFTSMMAWEQKKGVTREMKNTNGGIQYDADGPVTLTPEEMRELFDKDVIYDIQRP